jgi:drug/metabolite transporter (DMT)-like permease|uniref:EamA domain-containing protein n=1 Tax=viral metagenome TaxID=1070528 RepID=A0A6C0BF87_9ZZZZ
MDLVAAFITAMLWGIAPVVYRKLVHQVSYGFILIVSSIVYILSVTAYVFLFNRHEVINDFVNHTDKIPILACTTFFAFFIANMFYIYSIRKTHNINLVTIISALYPIVTLILASIVLKENLSIMGLSGFGLIVLGMIIIIMSSKIRQ